MSRKSKSFHPSPLPLFLEIPPLPLKKIKETKNINRIIIIDTANDSIENDIINEYQIS